MIEGRMFLVVEDNPINQQIALAFLTAAGGRAEAVADGEAAVARATDAAAEAFDAILMDIELPGIDGVETARRIRTAARAPSVIVAMTGHAAETERLAGAAGLFDGHLTKPFDRSGLDRAVTQALRQAASRSQTTATRPAAQPVATPVAAAPGGAARHAPTLAGGLDLSRLRTIDASSLIAILGDAAFVARLLLQLRDNEIGLADDIDRALAEDRPAEAARLAHRIKGVAGNLRAGAVYAAASEMEARLLGSAATSELTTCAATLRAALSALAADIDAARSGSAQVRQARKGVSDATLLRKMRRLARLMRDQDLAADDLWEGMVCAVDARDADVAAALDAAVSALDYPRASSLAAAYASRLNQRIAS